MTGKTRPVVVLLADNIEVPRSLVIYVPVTTQSRSSDLEVKLGHLRFIDEASVANVQAVGAIPRVRFIRKLGVTDEGSLRRIKDALAKACGL